MDDQGGRATVRRRDRQKKAGRQSMENEFQNERRRASRSGESRSRELYKGVNIRCELGGC